MKKLTNTGTMAMDERGKLGNYNTVSAEREVPVIEHIQQFLTVESHYVRRGCKWEYLPEELSVKEMHRMYKKYCAEKGYSKVESYDFYLRTFTSRFNLKFHKPKKDACDMCSIKENTPEKERSEEQIIAYKNHLNEKEAARKFKCDAKTKAAEDSQTVVAAFDLQKTLLCPYGQSSSFYYSQRLRNYNFTITNINSMDSSCFLRNETEARKGSCEVATAVFKYLIVLDQQKKHTIHLFCDRCAGQNNNRTIVAMLSHAIAALANVHEITLSFLIIGHSQNENDTVHSIIETATKKKKIFTTDQWLTAIAMSFKKHVPTVEAFDHNSILDFKSMPNFAPLWKSTLKIREGKNAGEKVYWTKIMQMKFQKRFPGELHFKYTYANEPFQKCVISTVKQVTRRSACQEQIVPNVYEKKVGITAEKQKALMKLCDKNLIPQHFHQFYESLSVNDDSC